MPFVHQMLLGCVHQKAGNGNFASSEESEVAPRGLLNINYALVFGDFQIGCLLVKNICYRIQDNLISFSCVTQINEVVN